MQAGVKNLSPLVKCAASISIHNEIFFPQAQITFLGGRIKFSGPVQDLPAYLIVYPSILELPDVDTEAGFVSVFWLVKIPLVLLPSLLEFSTG